jgi:hypothetical protein
LPRSFLRDLGPDERGYVGVDTEERDGVVDESEFDVPTRRQPSAGIALLAQARDARQPPGAYDVRTASTYGTGLTTARISTWM